MTVVSLAERRQEDTPHVSGFAQCLTCKHEWTQVAPVGTVQVDCPECKGHKGIFKYIAWPADTEVWNCACGCNIFMATRQGVYCVHCGIIQNFPK